MVRIKDEIMSYYHSGNLQAERRKRRYHYSALGIGLETFQNTPHKEHMQVSLEAANAALHFCSFVKLSAKLHLPGT